jgi:hypothetical protein
MFSSINFANEKKIDRTPIRYKNFLNYLLTDEIKMLGHEIFYSNIFQEGRLRRKALFYIVFEIQPTPSSNVYTLLLVYKERGIPYIYILNPNLQEESNGLTIPHLYDQKRLRLCLYYPNYNEFESNDYIAEQIIPWIKLWLFHYEVWLYTKEWLGGGIHPGDEKDTEAKQQIKKKKQFKSKKYIDENEYISIANNIYFEVKKALNEVA